MFSFHCLFLLAPDSLSVGNSGPQLGDWLDFSWMPLNKQLIWSKSHGWFGVPLELRVWYIPLTWHISPREVGVALIIMKKTCVLGSFAFDSFFFNTEMCLECDILAISRLISPKSKHCGYIKAFSLFVHPNQPSNSGSTNGMSLGQGYLHDWPMADTGSVQLSFLQI